MKFLLILCYLTAVTSTDLIYDEYSLAKLSEFLVFSFRLRGDVVCQFLGKLFDECEFGSQFSDQSDGLSSDGSYYTVLIAGTEKLRVKIHLDPCAITKTKERTFGHECDLTSTRCTHKNESYECKCLDGYIRLDEKKVQQCTRSDWLTRDIIMAVQVTCIVAAVSVAIAIFTQRKTKVMSSSMWPVSELVVAGAIVLYLTIVLRAVDKPPNSICIVEPWLREIGFSLCYGSITLKIYRSLVEFRTRKAHRWVVREKDILRYLTTIVAVVVFYMTAWTVTNSIHIPQNLPFCPITHWHRVTEFGELLFLFVGLHMAYHLRTAQSAFRERQFYSVVLGLETVTSIATIVLRETRQYTMEDESLFLLLLYFSRCQLSITTSLFAIFVPKFYYIHEEKKKRGIRRGEGGTTRIVKALDAINGDLDLAEVNISEMDPQDIRMELKRVYTQLELLRNKTMRKDNPHISKRRGGRKPTHRRFSLQKKGSRDKALNNRRNRSFRYHGDDIEDSVCSIEGPSTYSEAGR